MYSKINTCILEGLEGHVVDVETDITNGIPIFNIVGLAGTSIKESKERVRAAIVNSGYVFPLKRITINLAPANLRKEGSLLDLSIGIGILKSSGVIKKENLEELLFLGELSLDGRINKIQGALPLILSLRNKGIKTCIVPFDNKEETNVFQDIEIIPVKTLKDVVDYLNGVKDIQKYRYEDSFYEEVKYNIDYSEVKGQDSLKRALEISAAGGHNILIIGPPGSGKTMAVKRLITILPDLSFEESIETTQIYSVSGMLKEGKLLKTRPFREPHHSTSQVSLIGGGRNPKPGEISFAHNGVLFLDELTEFNRKTLEVLRQPLEEKCVHISRLNSRQTYPANFILVASMNPCPCGYNGDRDKECTCTQSEVDRYLGKISHPLLDRIDMHIEVRPVNYKELHGVSSIDSASLKNNVIKARKIQYERFKDENIALNSDINSRDIGRYCVQSIGVQDILKLAFNKFNFSARSYNKILKLARTIADLDGSEDIEVNHISEAISYRTLKDKYW